MTKPTKTPKPNKKRRPRFRTVRPVKFRHTGMAARIQYRDSHASSSHEVSLEPIFKRREDLGKHSVYIHFPKPKLRDLSEDRNYKSTVQKTHWRSRTSCRKFCDLITADHKVLSDKCESRNNHRYAVVVQYLATQWIQANPCKTKTSQETQRSLQKIL